MLSRNLTAKVTLLSDLHIGTGTNLIDGLDWISRSDGYVYMADHAAIGQEILDRAIADGKDELMVINAITGMKLNDLVDAGWLTSTDFQNRRLFPYRLRGQPATVQLREQIKTVNRELYLPGSTLKGALRTVIATVAAKELEPDVRVERLDRRRTWAARPVEQILFGQDPNHDFMRLLQVSDSAPVSLEQLRLRRAHIYPTASQTQRGRSRGLDIDLEAVAKGTEFTLNLHMPLELLKPSQGAFEARRAAELKDWERRRKWLERLGQHGRAYARQLLIDEVTYFQTRTDVPAVHRFYNIVAERFAGLSKTQFMLPIGWGGGWHTKTLNQYLKKDAANFEQIAKQFRLDPTGDRQPGDRFPKSRHLLRQPNGEPGEPLGWCLIELSVSE
jgi:CRISPR-associated protein Csm5